MRVSVVGSSGSGKTTLARRLERELGLPRIELDAINWGPGWRERGKLEPEAFIADVEAAISPNRWVCDGNYSQVRERVWSRATHLVWLDYERSVIMPQLFKRSLIRALDGKELYPGTGNRESFRKWASPGHPLRWAWDTWADRRKRFEALLAGPELSHLRVLRLRHPRELDAAVATLKAEAP